MYSFLRWVYKENMTNFEAAAIIFLATCFGGVVLAVAIWLLSLIITHLPHWSPVTWLRGFAYVLASAVLGMVIVSKGCKPFERWQKRRETRFAGNPND